MTSVLRLCAILIVAILVGPTAALAGKPEEGCRFQGSWMGYDGDGIANWVVSVQGQGSSEGTSQFEVAGFDLTLFGLFPTAERSTVARGAWDRIDDYTFRNTAVGLVVGSGGHTLYTWKLAAIDTLSPDCNSVSIINTVEFFYPDKDPNEDAPFYVLYGNPHSGIRITVDSPAFP